MSADPIREALSDERKAFEAAWRKEYPLHGESALIPSGFNPDRYANTRVNDGWLMWQDRAALARPVDQGAAVAKRISLHDDLMHAKAVMEGREPLMLRAAPQLPSVDQGATIAALEDALREIGDFAHDRSTGPAVPDALWEIRAMAYAAFVAPQPSGEKS